LIFKKLKRGKGKTKIGDSNSKCIGEKMVIVRGDVYSR
jgi:hypothetical protein